MATQELSLDSINIYGGTQARVQTTDEAVESYADEMTQGTVFPPIDVYFDGATYWLADGFHRYLATKRNQLPTILATVQPGGRSDALRHALGANATTASTAPTPTNATPPKSPSKNGPTRPTPYSPSCAVYPSISFAAAATKWPRPASSTSRRP